MRHDGAMVWGNFLGQVLPDPATRDMVQRMVGVGHYDEHNRSKLLIFVGFGANGKTTMARALHAALGTMVVERVPELAPAQFTVATINPPYLAPLHAVAPVVPFQVEIPRAEMDPSLPERLTEPDVQAAVLVWAFEGYLMAKV